MSNTVTMKSSLLSLLAVTTLSLAQYTPNVPLDNRTLSQIYAAARKEHTSNSSRPLQAFFGGDAGSQGDAYRQAWKQQFPDIPLNLTVALSKYHDGRIDRAFYEGGESVADIVALQTLQDFPRWKDGNRLMYYKPAHWDDLLNSEKDLDGAYYPLSVFGFGTFYYDPSKISASEVPSSYASLADPSFHSKLVLTYPNDDDAVAYLFSLIVTRYGSSWLSAVASNNVTWVRGTGTPAFILADNLNNTDSKLALSFTTSPETGLESKEVSAPEKAMAWPQTIAILADTPLPESAKLFISWVTGPEYQNASSAGGQSVLESLNKANGVDLYGANNTDFTGFKLFEADRARVERWKNVFEDALGTPQGVDPLQVYPNPPYSA